MIDSEWIDAQLLFYKKGRAGCLFAAHAARDPSKFGWRLLTADPNPTSIALVIESAICLPEVSTQSILFPSVRTTEQLMALLRVFKSIPGVALEQEVEFEESVCLGFRIGVGTEQSWVTGFGPFPFLPQTRQAPVTEVTFRSKPRPPFKSVMKAAPPGVLHLADMHMKGLRKNKFEALWSGSLEATKTLIGHPPDLRSAAKTTFAVPLASWTQS